MAGGQSVWTPEYEVAHTLVLATLMAHVARPGMFNCSCGYAYEEFTREQILSHNAVMVVIALAASVGLPT